MTTLASRLELTKWPVALLGLAVAGCALLVGATIAFLRGAPEITLDQGVYLSIAARMLDGDHIYVQLFDNKDPLFYYTYAGALWIGGWRGPFALDGLWLAVAAISITLLLRELRAPRLVLVAAFVGYPLALTIGWYQQGLSMLGGLAFTPLAGWLWLRGKFATAGALLAITVLFKLNLGLVAVAPAVGFFVLGEPPGSRVRQVARAALGCIAALAAAAALLAARGELRGYIDAIDYNLRYPTTGLQGRRGGVLGHLEVVYDGLGAVQTVAALIALAAFFVLVYRTRRRADRAFRLLVSATTATVAATVLTLALTALWRHHLQMLAFPLVLVAAGFICIALYAYGSRAGTLTAVAVVTFLVLANVRAEVRFGPRPGAWFETPHSVPAAALDAARVKYFRASDHVTYMHLGQNTEDAHAVFISKGFDLACPRFQQYPSDPGNALSDTLACVRKELPQLIVVTRSLFYDPAQNPTWQAYVSGAERLLSSRYVRVSDSDGVQVWKRKPAART